MNNPGRIIERDGRKKEGRPKSPNRSECCRKRYILKGFLQLRTEYSQLGTLLLMLFGYMFYVIKIIIIVFLDMDRIDLYCFFYIFVTNGVD